MPDYFHPLRVCIDGNEANCPKRVGSNAYAFHLLTAMAETIKKKRKGFHFTILLDRPPLPDMPQPGPHLTYRVVAPPQLWTQFALPAHLFFHERDYDVFFTPGHYAPRLTSLPYICSVMDLAFLAYPELFRTTDRYKLERWTKYSVAHAAKIVAISKYTKNEIVKYYGRRGDDIILAPPGFVSDGVNLTREKCAQILAKLGVTRRYFLYLGTLQPRKNIERLIKAFEKFIAKNSRSALGKYLLVLAGKNGWLTTEIEEALIHSPVREQIMVTGFVTAKEKAALLVAATAVCNLGIYEGFGIPALEALAYHALPIYANNTALPEVVGGAGISVNPFSVNKIAAALTQAATLSKAARLSYSEKAKEQLEKFSYKKSANQVLTALYRLRP